MGARADPLPQRVGKGPRKHEAHGHLLLHGAVGRGRADARDLGRREDDRHLLPHHVPLHHLLPRAVHLLEELLRKS